MRAWVVFPACLLLSCSKPPVPIDERPIAAQAGTVQSPILSRDGLSIAFASVADGYSNPQIWVGRADGSAPPRPLTTDAAKNYDPEFSPDGRTIYFTSSRTPEGIYSIPSSGGTPELFLENAYSLKISPDGATILYGNSGRLLRRALAGGPATLVLPDIPNSFAPLWSPDGTRILVTTTTPPNREPEWWIAPTSGGDPRQTSFGADLRAQGFTFLATNAWLPGDWIVFTGGHGETQTLWKVQVDPNGKPLGNAVRATQDAEGDFNASFTAGKLVFARSRVDANFWALPLDSTGEHATAPPEPLTSTPARKGQESVAGTKVLYSAENGDRYSLFLKDAAGESKNLRDSFYSVLAPDGSRYAYGDGVKEQLAVSLKSLSWWSFWSTTLCQNCGMPRQFTADGSKLLLWTDAPPRHSVEIMDLATRQITPVIPAADDLKAPRLSPDGQWISFVAQRGSPQWQAFVVAVNAPANWIPVTPPSNTFFYALWSERGDMLYTLSSHSAGGNLRFVDVQKLNPGTKRPEGAPAPLYEFGEMLVPGMDPVWNNVSVQGGRLVLELGGVSSGVWIKNLN